MPKASARRDGTDNPDPRTMEPFPAKQADVVWWAAVGVKYPRRVLPRAGRPLMTFEALAANWQATLTAAVVVATLLGLLFVQRAPDMIMLGGVVVLMLAGVLRPAEALRGMANEGMIAVAALFVVAAGVERTGVLAVLVERVLGRPQSLSAAQLRTMIGPGILSAFMNNTPVVALLVPAIREWAKKNRLSVSKLLMPMNTAVVLGGLCTLIGTSTNVIVSGLVKDRVGGGLPAPWGVFDVTWLGIPAAWGGYREFTGPLGMFDITWLGLPLFAVGIGYGLVASRFLLKDRRPPVSRSDDPRQYSLEMVVEPGSGLVGRTIEQAGLRHLDGLFLMEIDRGDHVIAAVSPSERLEAGDRLVFVGVIDSVVELQKVRGLRPATEQVFKLDDPRSERRLVEAGCVVALTIHGFQAFANAAEHVRWFQAHGGRVSEMTPEDPWPAGATAVSLDLDVIDQAFAPGVSAMNPCGWTPAQAERWVAAAGRNPRVRCFDMMELSPANDPSGRTARLAAHLLLTFLRAFGERPA
jgi:hypothetical protein